MSEYLHSRKKIASTPILIHLDIKTDGKIWIQENVTDLAIDDELLKRGIPQAEIVLGLQPPSYRKFTEFADS